LNADSDESVSSELLAIEDPRVGIQAEPRSNTFSSYIQQYKLSAAFISIDHRRQVRLSIC